MERAARTLALSEVLLPPKPPAPTTNTENWLKQMSCSPLHFWSRGLSGGFTPSRHKQRSRQLEPLLLDHYFMRCHYTGGAMFYSSSSATEGSEESGERQPVHSLGLDEEHGAAAASHPHF
ncbi:hypothetical protein EYF80_030666 [Liparis tanakae]|uniref:Uncharacterized protein n=1 Tax=Liparis tanakae TaxID=230148 RepID=A0A4Z2H2N7_9TELE|nr:hypothetical protein EYF80_030666 [Liparis tanakae]